MTTWSARDVAGFWVGAGGPANRAVEWVAIAMGESSLDDSAVSSAGAIGLWQIMPFNAGPNGVSVGQLYDPRVNARVAVQMSGHGTNCAAWDSAYANINASGRYTFLAWPERGSADYNNIPVAAAEIGGRPVPVMGGGPAPSVGQNIGPALERLGVILHKQMPAIFRVMHAQRRAFDRMYVPGWRP